MIKWVVALITALFLPQILFAQPIPTPRDIAIEQAFQALQLPETNFTPTRKVTPPAPKEDAVKRITETKPLPKAPPQKEPSPGEKDNIWRKVSDDIDVAVALDIGYLKGNTSYDFAHHTSELDYPMSNFMMGTDFTVGYKDWSFNTQFWSPLEHYAGPDMEDKDWLSNGELWSFTKSKAYLDAIIWESCLRYDFYKKTAPEGEQISLIGEDEPYDSEFYEFNVDAIRVGALLGYKFERLDFDMYDLYYDTDLFFGHQGQTLYAGTRVATYKVRFRLPYIGLAADFLRDNAGFSLNFKYSFYPTADDVDNHLLRGLTFYGNYHKKRQGYMFSMSGFWDFMEQWKLKTGADATFVRIDGHTWDETHNPDWNDEQSIDMKQWVFWSGIEYRF